VGLTRPRSAAAATARSLRSVGKHPFGRDERDAWLLEIETLMVEAWLADT
jgi:hypothetical protein